MDGGSPIERYVKLYVDDMERREHLPIKEKFQHLKGCIHYNGSKIGSPRFGGGEDLLPLPSSERQVRAINEMKDRSVEEVVQIADKNSDAKSVLQHRAQLCNCHLHYKESLRHHLTKSPSKA